MNIRHFSAIGLSALSAFVLSSCFDNDYDLSDIDTMSRFKTKNLTVPLNLDVITLDLVMDLGEDSEVKKFVNEETGERFYAIQIDGDFHSDPIKVNDFTALSPHIAPTVSELNQDLSILPQGIVARYPITSEPTSFESKAENVDASIKSIESVGVDTKFTIEIQIDQLGNYLNNVYFKGVEIQFPKGLTATPNIGTFDANTGKLTLPEMQPDNKGKCMVTLNITAINGEEDNVTYNSTAHTLLYKDQLEITAGEVEIRGDITADFPTKIKFTSSPTLDAIKILTFTGEMEYEVEDFNIDPIDLTNIPTIINQPGTKLMLEKPQIFLSLNNPMAKYNVYFESGFGLTSERTVRIGNEDVKKQKNYELDANSEGKKIFDTKTTDGSPQQTNDNQFALAPSVPDYHEDFPNPKFVPFSDLKRILLLDDNVDEEEAAETGVGIPTTIRVNVKEPKMPTQRVADFVLGEKLDAVAGKYAFYAPLQLSEKSQIAYTDTIKGWNDEDVDNITIDALTINFDATTEIPFETALTIYPIDTTGKPIAGVKTTTAHIDAKAQNQPIEVRIIGPITHLDGLLIKAHIVNTESDLLGPDMKIYVNNSKAKVTGHYDKEL